MADLVGSTKTDDLELDAEENAAVSQSPSVRKTIFLKLKPKSRGGRVRKTGRGGRKAGTRGSKSEQETEQEADDDALPDKDSKGTLEKTTSVVKLEEGSPAISKLESPCSLASLERIFTEPMHQNKKLNWNHKVNLIGEKILNPMIHCCEKCGLPILIYGRMIPCRHVFCLECARKNSKICLRCKEVSQRVEPSSLGMVFICLHESARHSTEGCRRTYLSQRDLQAHINHRHERPRPVATSTVANTNSPNATAASLSADSNNSVPPPPPQAPPPLAARNSHLTHEVSSHTPPISSHMPQPHPLMTQHLSEYRPEERALMTSVAPPSLQPPPNSRPATHLYSHPPPSTPTHTHASYPSPIPVVSTRSNLITVPIQDDSSSSPHLHPPQQTHLTTPSLGHPPTLPPQHTAVTAYTTPPPPSHHYPPSHTNQPPPYSQPQTFNLPTHIPPPTIHNPNPPPPPLFTGPPPPVHHAPPPISYNPPPPIRQHSLPPPPQRFPVPANYKEASPYTSNWGASRPPPPAHAPLAPRPLGAPPGQPDPGYRPPPTYYP